MNFPDLPSRLLQCLCPQASFIVTGLFFKATKLFKVLKRKTGHSEGMHRENNIAEIKYVAINLVHYSIMPKRRSIINYI